MSGLKRSYYISPATVRLLSEIYGENVQRLSTMPDELAINRLREIYGDLRSRLRELRSRYEGIAEELANLLTELNLSRTISGQLNYLRDQVKSRVERIDKLLASPVEDIPFYRLPSVVAMLAGEYLTLRTSVTTLSERISELRKHIADLNRMRESFENLKGEIDNLLSESESLLQKWFPEELQRLRGDLRGIRESEDLESLQKSVSSLLLLREKFNSLLGEANSLETAYQAREKVVNALKRTCEEMGWKEIESPHLEREGDLRSDVIYKVNTYSAGEMIFRISLESIEVNSPFELEGGFCLKQFEVLSEKLRKLGVNTNFKREESDDEDPILLRKGALDLPDSGEYKYYEDDGYWEDTAYVD